MKKSKVGQQLQKILLSTSSLQHKTFQNSASHFSPHRRPQTSMYVRNLAKCAVLWRRPAASQYSRNLCNGSAAFEATDQKHLDEWTNRQTKRPWWGRVILSASPVLTGLQITRSTDSRHCTPPSPNKKPTASYYQCTQHQYHISLVNTLWSFCAVTWQLLACVGVKLVYILVTDTNRPGELNVPEEAGSCLRTSCLFARGSLTSPTD